MTAPAACQRGLAAVLLLLLLLLGAGALLLERGLPAAQASRRAAASDAALALAKEALLGYALTYGELHSDKLPGVLPCPDTTPAQGVNAHEGSADPPCGRKDVSVVGRFPWHGLELGPVRDGSGECLWYAVSGNFKNDPDTDMLNWDSLGQLVLLGPDGASRIAGASPEDRAAALIVAPGEVLAGQERDSVAAAKLCGGNYVARNYLEAVAGADNAAASPLAGALSLFASGGAKGGNDRLLVVSPSEIFVAIQQRSDFRSQLDSRLEHLAACIAAYGRRNAPGDLRLPWAAPVALADYADASAYSDASGLLAGRLPYRAAASKLRTANAMAGSRLFEAASCAWSAKDDEWYRHWKDQIFYAVARDYAPGAAAPGGCGACLSVNGGGRYAAIILFAGPRLAGQTRSTPVAKAAVANYLEGQNAAAVIDATGTADFSSLGAASRNDILFCIDATLAVAPCA